MVFVCSMGSYAPRRFLTGTRQSLHLLEYLHHFPALLVLFSYYLYLNSVIKYKFLKQIAKVNHKIFAITTNRTKWHINGNVSNFAHRCPTFSIHITKPRTFSFPVITIIVATGFIVGVVNTLPGWLPY